MSGAGRGILIVLCINLMFFFAQLAMDDINPGGGTTLLNYEGSPLSAYDGGGYVLNESTDFFPSNAGSVSPTTGNFFTDPLASIKNWFLDVTGLRFVTSFLFAMPNFLKALGLPGAVSFGISALWYGYGIFLVVSYLWGRDD